MRRPAIAALPLIVSALSLGACGGGSNDKAQITQIIKDYNNHPVKLCTDYATAYMIRSQFVTKAACLSAASFPAAPDPKVKVNSVSVKGNKAVAIRTTGTPPGVGRKAEVDLIKRGKKWKIDQIFPIRG